jgi:hypothetical protein
MSSARPSAQTARVTARRAPTRATGIALGGSSCVDRTTSGGHAIASRNRDGGIITGSSVTDVVSIGCEQFQFSMPGNGWATVDYVP